MDTRYENRYWEIEEIDNTLVGKLHFTQFYDDEILLSFQQDKDDKETFWYVSDLLRVEVDCIIADTPDEAIEQFEDKIMEHIEDEICTFEDMKEKFNEVSLKGDLR